MRWVCLPVSAAWPGSAAWLLSGGSSETPAQPPTFLSPSFCKPSVCGCGVWAGTLTRNETSPTLEGLALDRAEKTWVQLTTTHARKWLLLHSAGGNCETRTGFLEEEASTLALEE